ncbi:MAG: hypothetical protein QUV05_14385 [Phycisphaerae bacterium]|nr:hypothetical protein [Phycisphaerae bacterium]
MTRYRTRIVLAFGWTVAAVASTRGGPNLIRNPGFEEGESPTYPGVGLHWETNDAQPHPDIDVLTTSTRHSGSCSQWLKAHETWDLGMVRQLTPYHSITAGKTYRISGWIKTANVHNPAGWYVFGAWYFDDDTRIGESKMPQQETLNYDWREIAWTVVAPAEANRIAVLLTRHTDGDVWYDDISVTEVSPGPPLISVSPNSFEKRVLKGQNAESDVPSVQNVGGGTLNYTLTDEAGWLDYLPSAGTGTGETDAIVVLYDTADLPVGRYQTSITVADPAAANPLVSVPVDLTVWTWGDLDGDGDVDQTDFGLLQTCYSGNGIIQTAPACADAIMDADGDVDPEDFALFLGCLSGPGVEADEHCAD